MGKRKVSIEGVCIDIRQIADEELEQMREIAKDQLYYLSPLKCATQARMNKLGEHNIKILDALQGLRDMIREGEVLYRD